MSQLNAIGVADSDLTKRLKLVNLLPSAVLIATVAAFLLAGAPAHRPSFETMVDNARTYGWTGGAAAMVITLIIALLLQPLELASIRLLEGYWKPGGPLAKLSRFGLWVQGRQQSRLAWIVNNCGEIDPSLAEDAEERLRSFPSDTPLLPTALGNRLRAAEERAGQPYSLEAIPAWTRLYFVLPDEALNKVNEFRNQLDVSARLCLVLALNALITAGLLLMHGWWMLVSSVFFLLSLFAYRSAVSAATAYGYAFQAAIDVYRFKLLQAMRVELPRDLIEERKINEVLSQIWTRQSGSPTPSLRYSKTDQDIGLSDKRWER